MEKKTKTKKNLDPNCFEALLNERMPEISKKQDNSVKRGDYIEASVVDVKEDRILLDLNMASEGVMYIDNYTNDPRITSFKGRVRKGDRIEAVVKKITEDQQVFLSRLPILNEKMQAEIVSLCEKQKIVKVLLKEHNKGGFVGVFSGVEVFFPYSNLDYEIVQNKDEWVGKEVDCYIQEANFIKSRPKVIATRRPIFEEERRVKHEEEKRLAQEELDTIKTGDILEGTITSIKPYGAFVKFNNLVGIIRLSQISHHRVNDINDVLHVDDKVRVKVLKKEGSSVDVSIKALQLTPFQEFIKVHHVGDEIKGKIVQKMPFGYFVEVAKDLRALLHRFEFVWDPKDNFATQSKIGDEVSVKIIKIEVDKEQIAISRKALIDNPWANVNLKKDDNVECIIEEFAPDKVFVSACGVQGFIKNEEMDLKKGKPVDIFTKGEKVMAKVKYVNKNFWQLELSLKRYNFEALQQDIQNAEAEEASQVKKTKSNKELKKQLSK